MLCSYRDSSQTDGFKKNQKAKCLCSDISVCMLKNQRKWTPDIHWRDWCGSWSSDTLATWCEELTHCKRPWSWERLRARGEGDGREWDGWMAPPTQLHVSLSKLWGIVKDREAWRAAVHGATKSQMWVSDWTTTTIINLSWEDTLCQAPF